MNTTTLLFHAISRNAREHPLSAALLYLYCPAAAYWWRAGVEITPPYDPVWQAVQDYTATPRRTLREHLVDYGLESLVEDARRYIDQVVAARKRLPHVRSPELLPTFPGGKLPLRKRFGIREALERIGGAEGFFAYVRTWAFLVFDWLSHIHFPDITLDTIEVQVMFRGLKRPYRLPAWAVHSKDNGTGAPLGFGIPAASAPDALAALYYFAQSPDKVAWKRRPQIWLFSLDGDARHVDPLVPPESIATALLKLATMANAAETPIPIASVAEPHKCAHCPFHGMCFNERLWTPQAARWMRQRGALQPRQQGGAV